MSSSTVFVKNISEATSEQEIREFFSFCGKISKLEVTSAGATKEATVTFEKPTAAKTALLLDGTLLQKNTVSVSSASTSDEHEEYNHGDAEEITQEMKPRSRIIAEYLAHGYVVSDLAAQRAIDLDQKHGVSSRFMDTLTKLDTKYHATDKAKSVDQTYGLTNRANSLLSGITSYFEKAGNTPTGQRLVNFYTQSQQQVIDIHNEARRLADLKKKEAGSTEKAAGLSGTSTCKCGSSSSCSCPPGTCSCANCAKESSEVKSVPGTSMTTCSCGGKNSECACEPGHCACSSCPKAATKEIKGTGKTTCQCGGNDGGCACAEGKCACAGCAK